MAVTQAWNGRGMGVDARSAAVNAVKGPVMHRRPPMIFNFKKKVHCTDDITYHAH